MKRTLLTLLSLSAVLGLLLRAEPAFAAPTAPADSPGVPLQASPNSVLEIDRNGIGLIDYRISYDKKGAIFLEELDYNDDGKMDSFYYYEDGILRRVEVDSKFSGSIDLWIYMVDGTEIQRYEQDTDGDGKPDLVRDFGGS